MKQIGVCVNLQSKYSLDLTQFEKEGGKGIKKNRQKMNRIILIGNGFDLAHGLKTSYADFIDWYWEE